jgi:hypothetical protein
MDQHEADAEVGRLLREARKRWPHCDLSFSTAGDGLCYVTLDNGLVESKTPWGSGFTDAEALRALLGET